MATASFSFILSTGFPSVNEILGDGQERMCYDKEKQKRSDTYGTNPLV